MIFQTQRLIIRPWEEQDASSLYHYASHPDVGPRAGWRPHRSLEESKRIIETVFSAPQAYALCLKEDSQAIGAIELLLYGRTNLAQCKEECALGYWIGQPFWGQGLIPEAGRELLRHAFQELKMMKVFCGYYEGNLQSKRVQEKLGFQYLRTNEGVDVVPLQETRTEHISVLTRERWEKMVRESR